MSDIGAQVFLPVICEKLQQLAPHMRIAMEPEPLSSVEERMRLRQLDFAIGNLPTLKPVTKYALLFNEEYACMTRKRRGLPVRRITRDQFHEMSHVDLPSACRHSSFRVDHTLAWVVRWRRGKPLVPGLGRQYLASIAFRELASPSPVYFRHPSVRVRWLHRVGETHSSTARADIRRHRFANDSNMTRRAIPCITPDHRQTGLVASRHSPQNPIEPSTRVVAPRRFLIHSADHAFHARGTR